MWPNRTLFIGPFHQLSLHAIASPCVNVGIYQPFLVGTADGVQTPCRACIVPAGCRHQLNANGNLVASLVIENTTTDVGSIDSYQSFNTSSITPIPWTKWAECFQYIYEVEPSRAEITRLIDSLPGVDALPAFNLDPRIQTALDTINLAPADNPGLERLASSVGLSASRFRHLFQEQTNIPFRRYKQWRRVLHAMRSLHSAASLTHAALQSGFTDSAHFSRCFRDTFGVKPSLVFRNIDRFEV